MLKFGATPAGSPEIPRTGELRERGETRRLCVRGSHDAEDGVAVWIYEDDPVRVRIKGYAKPFDGIARRLEPGALMLDMRGTSFRLTVEQIDAAEQIPSRISLDAGTGSDSG